MIATIDLRHFEGPVWIVSHLESMRRIEQESHGRVRRPTLGMFFREAHKLVRDPSERIELKRMIARPRFEELISALLEINRRSSGHVVELITLAIPRQRRTHRWTITRVIKEIRPREILLLREGGGGVAEIWRVIIKKRAAELSRGAARESDAHPEHRHHCRRFHA